MTKCDRLQKRVDFLEDLTDNDTKLLTKQIVTIQALEKKLNAIRKLIKDSIPERLKASLNQITISHAEILDSELINKIEAVLDE